MRRTLLLSIIAGLMSCATAASAALDVQSADRFAALVLAGIDREYPNKPGEVLGGPQDLKTPRQMHPAFFGHYDWHSSVHGHWVLLRLLRLYPQIAQAAEIRARLDAHLDEANIRAEAAYFDGRENRSFERMYGWAWALRLALELHAWDDPEARRWSAAFAPLETKLVAMTLDYLPRLSYPVRSGVHPDTAFALAQILDYARGVDHAALEALVVRRARDYFLGDRDYPVAYEPSGQDFFSPGLNTADLMRRVLPTSEFRVWLDGFWPGLRRGKLGSWGVPAQVSDLEDPQLVHLVGLNLSRAWTMQGVSSRLDKNDRRALALEPAMLVHAGAGLEYVFSGHYEGEHWLATFAVYYLSEAGLPAGHRSGDHQLAPDPRTRPSGLR